MDVRSANDNDSNGIKSVVFQVLKEYGLEPDSGTTDKDLDTIEDSYHKNNGFFGVIENSGKIVATVGIYKIDNDTCELRKMYALPSQRGKGLGKYLMQFSIKKAKELGYKRIVLETATPLKEAVSLYKKFGFSEYTPSHLAARCDQAFELML